MKRSAPRHAVPLSEFLSREKSAGPARKKRQRASKSEGSHPKRHLLRFSLILACLALLLCATMTGELQSLFSDLGTANGAAVSNTSVTLHNKPAWPGCSSLASRKLTTEKVAVQVCESIVGIVQYQKGSLRETGEGSGIIMSSDGLIITNNHVVEGAARLEVVFKGGKKLAASLVGSDARTDIAVIKVQAKGLAYAQFGNSGQCNVGEQVVAIGNPSGLRLAGSVTQGIISAVDRNIDVGNGPMNLIQTDAAINPGNSGGALVNMYGQVVAINSAKISQQGYEGIGFSIPINTAKPVIDSILKYGYVKGRVRFGFNCREIDEMTAKLNEIPAGVYIDSVDSTGPAAKSGLLADDIITAIGSKAIATTDELITVRDAHKPGDRLGITVFRRSSGQHLTLEITLGEDRGDKQTMAKAGW
ncbi:MAG: trypsin-like peptidase domain-containing protein [Clostridia bacterium]|nr:trypsin-like peptidase domain-containing protein [Clostridia bacterium]